MEITPQLTNWASPIGTDIAQQFKDAFVSESNPLALPRHFKDFKDRKPILNFITSNHPSSIVRTKACIILSRTSNGLHPAQNDEWDIDVLRQLILTDWDDISYNITPRWCIAILNCFAEHGKQNERVVANSISMMYNILLYGPLNDTQYKADDTFINSMLRINLSLTDAVRLVTITTLDILRSNEKYLPGFTYIAEVWKMIIEMELTDREQVQYNIDKHFPDMDRTNNKQLWTKQ